MRSGNGEESVHVIVDRLNAEKRKWSYEVVSHSILESEVVVLARLVVDDVTKMAFGSAALSRDSSGKAMATGADLKLAANDALVRAARLMSVGLVFEGSSPEDARAPAATVDDRVTQKQLGMIHGLTRRKNIGRAELGSLLHGRFRKTELVALTKREASELIRELGDANGVASA